MPTSKSAVAAEALGESIPFVFDGDDYSVLPTNDWPFEAVEQFEAGRVAAFLQIVLGAEQYAAFRAKKYRVAKVNDFVVALQKAVGISGN